MIPPQTARPVCPKHFCKMTAYATKEQVTHYRCPVEGCSCTDARDRGANALIPSGPQICPRCGVACEVDHSYLSPVLVHLECPARCGFSVKISKVVNDPRRRRRSPDDIMDV